MRVYDARAEVETAEGVYRLGSRSMREAMPGDRVYVSLHRGKGGARRAVVEHVIDRAVAAIVGVFEPAGPLGAVRPLDTRIKQDFFVLPADDSPRRLGVEPGDIVSARIVDYPSRTESGVVTLERRIGDANEPSLGIECVMARYGLVDGYPQAAVDEAASLAVDVEGALADPLRRDIRDRFAITIDPVDARFRRCHFRRAHGSRRMDARCAHRGRLTLRRLGERHRPRGAPPLDLGVPGRSRAAHVA